MEKLKIGVFGGGRGITMMNVLLSHPEAELCAVCDKYVPFLDKVKELVAKTGQSVSVYESFDEFVMNRYAVTGVPLARRWPPLFLGSRSSP